MAKTASTAAAKKGNVNDWLEEYVEVKLFKDGKDYRDDVFVSVNGESCLIKRGEPVKIKRKFALVLEQSERQDAHTEAMTAARAEEWSGARI